MRSNLGYFFILAAAAQWSMVGPLILFCLKGGMEPIEIAFWRTAAAGCLFCLHAALTGTLKIYSLRDGLAFLAFGVICIGGLFSLYQNAVKEGGAALAAILVYTAPIWVAITSRIFFKERLSPLKLTAIGLSITGVACISLSGGSGTLSITPLAVAFGLGSGLLYSCHYIFAKRYLQRYSPFALYGFCMLAGAAACFPFTPVNPARIAPVWLPLLAAIIIGSYTSFWVYSEGLKRVEATKAVILATVEPMLATLIAWWWWDEFFAPMGWLGAALVLSAVLLIIVADSRSAVDGKHRAYVKNTHGKESAN